MTDCHYTRTLQVFAEVTPDRVVISTPNQQITARELFIRAAALAGHLYEAGVREGMTIATMLINRPAILEAFYAALMLGARPANVNSRYGADEIAFILVDCHARVLIHEPSAATAAGEAIAQLEWPVALLEADSDAYAAALTASPAPAREPRPDDQLIWYTGGTTGKPKGVMWEVDTHYRMLWEVVKPDVDPPDPELLASRGRGAPTTLPGSPLAHGTAMGLTLNTLNGAGTVVLHEQASFDAAATLALIERDEVKVLGIVGDAYARPLLAELDTGMWVGRLDSLAVLSSSGAVWSAEVRARLRDHLPDIRLIDNFGSTEALVTRDVDGEGFQPRPGLAVLADDDTIVTAGAGQIGTIATAGRLPLGYLNDPEKTAAAFRTIDGVRYLLIGDKATVADDGRITILGRGNSSINTGGEKVWPEEVEMTVRDHPAVHDAAIIGLPDEKWGQRVTAVIALQQDSTVLDDELAGHCRTRLAGYKCPKQWIRVDEVPRTYVGKPDYPAIRTLIDNLESSPQQ